MNPKSKTLLIALVAILLIGIGYFGVFKAKRQPQPPVNIPPKTEEIDISDWQTYRNETLGFEIKMPKEWVKSGEDIGPQPNLEDEFWQDQVGGVSFRVSMTEGHPQFSVRIKDTDNTMDGFGFSINSEDIVINGFPTRRRTAFPEGRSKIYSDFVLIRNEIRHYKIEFRSSINPPKEEIEIWNAILKTFKPIS